MTSIVDPTTELPQVATTPSLEAADDQPRPLHTKSVDDRLSLVGTVVASIGLTWIIYYGILPLNGVIGFVISWYFVFLAMYAGLTALSHPRPIVIDRVMRCVIWLGFLTVIGAAVWAIAYVVVKAWPALFHWNMYSQDGAAVGPLTKLNHGGFRNAIAGTFIILGIAVVISVPLGLATAVFMTEVGGWLSRVVRTVVEAMTAIPDLLAGLFIYAILVKTSVLPGVPRLDKNGLAVSLALTVTMTPIIARSAEVALRVVPGGLREASLALGATHWKTVHRIVIPTAKAGLSTALILAVARGIGESAPLLIVSGATGIWQSNPVAHHPMNSLPLYIYTNLRSGQPLLISRAFAAGVFLLFIVFFLFGLARLLARQRVTR
jgi:phosphate transport system permease protein